MFIIYHWMHRFTNILIKWCQARLRKTSRSFSISLSFQLCLPAPPYLMHVPHCLPIPLPPSLPLLSPATLSLPASLASWSQEWREACSYTGYEWLDDYILLIILCPLQDKKGKEISVTLLTLRFDMCLNTNGLEMAICKFRELKKNKNWLNFR